MNIAYELSRIKEAFEKVRADINFLGKKVTENYENFMREHYKLANQVKSLSSEIKSHSEFVKENHLKKNLASKKEIEDLKYIVKELKVEVEGTQKEHNEMHEVIRGIKDNKKEISKIKEKLESSELEIYLLKERLVEKDAEIKQMKEVSKSLFELVDEVAQLEKELIKH